MTLRGRRSRAVFVLSAALALGACIRPELSTRNCDVDWRAVGYADGANGTGPEILKSHRATCARIGDPLSRADQSEWLAGWRDGSAAPQTHRRDADAGNSGVPRKRYNLDLFYSSGRGNGHLGVFVDVFRLGLGWKF